MIYIYCRVSNTKEKSNSIGNQLRIIYKYINDNSLYGEMQEIIDEGYSGTNLNRPGIKSILEYIVKIKGNIEKYNKEKNMLIVKDISRLSRNYIDTGIMMKKFNENNVIFISVNDNYILKPLINNSYDSVYFDIQGLMADFYSKDISIKVKTVLEARKEKGYNAIPNVPYGYRKVHGEIKVHNKEAEVVRKIYRMYIEGKKIKEICCILDKENILTPMESKMKKESVHMSNWAYSSVKNILTNEFYIGTMKYNKTYRMSWDSLKREKNSEERIRKIKEHHIAIIDKKMYNQVREIMENRLNYF